jgi:endonuclease III
MAGAKGWRTHSPLPPQTDGATNIAMAARSTLPKAKPRKARAMTRNEVRGFLEALAKVNPDPRSELDYIDPYTLLVAVVLSAQATDVSVNRATETLFAEAATPEAMMRLGVDGVAKHIRSIGLWQGKARNVIELSRQLIEHHGGQVPRDREALETLPGVGRKTANVVLNVAFGESTMAVDTHIFRLGNRTGIAPGATPRAVEDALVRRIPPELLRDAHHWLILHGRYVCKARSPECWRCIAAVWCKYPDKTLAPAVKPAKPG